MNKLITMYFIIEHCYMLLYYITFVPSNRSFELLCDVLCSFERNFDAPKLTKKKKNHFAKFRGDLEIQQRSERATTGEYGG